MRFRLRFLPEVEEDALTGAAWYDRRSSGLGGEFLNSFYACAAEAADNPLHNRLITTSIRRRLIKRFPFVVYFQFHENEVVVLGVFHTARDPETVMKAIEDRETRR